MATTYTTQKDEKLQKNLKKATRTLQETFLSSKGDTVISSVIKDLSSIEKKLLPLSFGTMLKGLRFVLTNPVSSYNLIKLARSSDIYLRPEFQKNLLEKSALWDFLKKHADDLPEIGQILGKAGFKEFQEGSILDQKALSILKEGFKKPEVLKAIQEVAIELKETNPDWTKVTSKTLEMMSKDKNFKEFFNVKGQDIADYLHIAATKVTASDYLKSFDDILQKPENKTLYSPIIKIFNNDSNFKQELAENINDPKIFQSFNKLNPEIKTIMEGLIAEAKQTPPPLEQYFKDYKIDPKVLNNIPALLNKVPEVKMIFDSLNNPDQGLMIAVEKSLEMIAKDNNLRSFFAENKEFLPNMALGVIENIPEVQNATKDYNIDTSLLKIVGEMMSKPEIAYNIVNDMNTGDYLSVTNNLISSLNDPSFKLKDILVEQSKAGLFDKLTQGVLDQNEKTVQSANQPAERTIKQQLQDYGLEYKDIPKLTGVIPLLLDKPASLQKVFSNFVKGDYTSMAKELVTLTKGTPEIKEYLNNNKEIFARILDKTLVDVPAINKLDKDQLYGAIPSILNHPDDLIKILDGVENKNYASAALAVYSLAKKTNYFEGQLTAGLIAGVEVGVNYAAQKVTGIFTATSTIENSFEGKTLDGAILKTMLDGVKKGEIRLEGAKLVGDLSNIDLSDVSLKNTDLSKVTSLKDCNLKGTNLEGATLPDNIMLLADTYNLDKTSTPANPALVKEQQNKLIDKGVSKIFLQAQSEGKKIFPDKKEVAGEVKKLCQDSPEIRNYVAKKLNLLNSVKDITRRKEQLVHASQLYDSANQVLNPIYKNIANTQDIKNTIVANIISEKVTEQLFGNGDNRGQDAYLTQEMIQDVILDYQKDKPTANMVELLKPKNQEKLVNDIADNLKSKSKYTWAGALTGGFYLPPEIFNDELKSTLKQELVKSNEFKYDAKILKDAKDIASNVNKKVEVISNNLQADIKKPDITPSTSATPQKLQIDKNRGI